MVAILHVLNVPEFESLRVASADKAGITVTTAARYTSIRAAGELHLLRAETGLGKAVWYGALTGGYEGKVVRFDDEHLIIIDE